MTVIEPEIALSDDSIKPYKVSYKTKIADQTFFRAYNLSYNTAVSFAHRHNLTLPPLRSDSDN